ncbi:MAG TPA: hypothetical protein VFN03_05015 [Trueperaceae bacterium]|nr:hypothetical protein [Trueperaceae bacterium]
MYERSVYRSDTEVIIAACPACGGVIDLESAAQGMTLECPDCDELLLIADLEPLTLVVATDPDEVSFPEEDEQRD